MSIGVFAENWIVCAWVVQGLSLTGCPYPSHQRNNMEWISIKDKFPALGVRVLATDGMDVEIMIYYGHYKECPEWSSYVCNTLDVTHWMPLPCVDEISNGLEA